MVAYHLPIEKAVHDAYARGRLPVWINDISGGRPLLANPNVGALYPVRPLLSPLPFPLAMRLFPILHWILAGIGMIVLTQELGTSRSGAWVAGATYAFSGVGVSEVFYTEYQPGMSLLPWILWALVRRWPSNPRRMVALALLFTLDFLAGDVFTIGIAVGTCVLWILLEVPRRERHGPFLCLTGSVMLGALAAAPQIVATVLWIPYTHRAIGGMRLQESLGFSVSLWRVLELLVPYPFGPIWSLESSRIWGLGSFRWFFASLYCGAVAVIGVVIAWRSPAAGARLVRWLFLLALSAVVLPSAVPSAWRSLESPIAMRYPEKLSVALVFVLAIAAGLAVDRLRAHKILPRWILFTGCVLAAGAAAATWLTGLGSLATAAIGASPSWSSLAGQQIPGALAEAGLLWIASCVGIDLIRRDARIPAAAGLAVLTLVPVVASRRIARTYSEDELFAPSAFARAVTRRDPLGEFRTLSEMLYRPPSQAEAFASGADTPGVTNYRRAWFYYTPTLWDRATVFNGDLDVGDFSRMESLRRLSSFVAQTPGGSEFFSALALRFAIRYRDQDPLPGYRPFGANLVETWDENPSALPDLRLVRSWRECSGAVAALQTFRRLAAGEIVLETGRTTEGRSAAGFLRALERSPERIRLQTSVSSPSWLFALRGFWPYRDIRIDGRSAEPVPAELAFTGVAIPAGRHTVDWREQVPGWPISLAGPLCSAVAIGALLLHSRSSERAA